MTDERKAEVADLKVGQEVWVRAKIVDIPKQFFCTAEVEFPHGGTKPAYVDLRDVNAIAPVLPHAGA